MAANSQDPEDSDAHTQPAHGRAPQSGHAPGRVDLSAARTRQPEHSAADGAAPTPPPRRSVGFPLPEPVWRVDRRARSKPRLPLTRDAIVEAALRVLDRDGLDGMSMHRVAQELGTGAGSLYWHVRNKGELLQLLAERLLIEMELPEPDPTRWQEQLKELGRQMRTLSRRHRDGARITLGRLPSGPTLARSAEWLFELLTPVGIPDRVIAYLGDMVSLYVGAYAFEESLGVASPTGEDMPPDQIVAMFIDYLLSLPVENFPHIHRAIGDLFAGGPDERFEFGLEIILRGIGTYAQPPAPRSAEPEPPSTTEGIHD